MAKTTAPLEGCLRLLALYPSTGYNVNSARYQWELAANLDELRGVAVVVERHVYTSARGVRTQAIAEDVKKSIKEVLFALRVFPLKLDPRHLLLLLPLRVRQVAAVSRLNHAPSATPMSLSTLAAFSIR